jgi:hypothetical protein
MPEAKKVRDMTDSEYVWEMVMELQKMYEKDACPPELVVHLNRLVKISRRLNALQNLDQRLRNIKQSQHEFL